MDNSVQPQAPVVPDESVVMPGSNSTPPISAIPTDTTTSPTSSGGNVKPKRKLGPIVATIFGLLLLVGGVGAGLFLVNQQQHLGQKAAGACSPSYNGTTGFTICGPASGSGTVGIQTCSCPS